MSDSNKFPPAIYGSERGSWAEETITVRLPEILQRTVAENQFPDLIRRKLDRLGSEIPQGPIRFLEDQDSPDFSSWQDYIQPWEGKTWLQVPWFFAEHYFYRRIMEAVNFFEGQKDPFLIQKKEGYQQAQRAIAPYASRLTGWHTTEKISSSRMLREGLLRSLWGNQADLSLWPAGSEDAPDHATINALQDHLLEDHSSQVIRLLTRGGGQGARIAIILDNAGLELVSDLALADILLKTGIAAVVELQVKAHPTFVSDVIEDDVLWTVDALQNDPQSDVGAFGQRLGEHLNQRRLQIIPDFFWNSPLAMWKMPRELKNHLANFDLIISKGDANYRRILGDRKWDFTLPFSEVVDYLPVPLAALRALKAELALGLTLEDIQRIHNQDANWMVNGKWAVIQYSPAGKDQ